jgi:outer membrane protein assembly factor BamA
VNDNTVANPAATTLLTREKPPGINGGITSYIRAGIAYDTRDFAPDPHEGFLIDYAFEGASYAFGSNYDFIRNTFGFRFYTTWFDALTLAIRLGFVASFYDMPFYEMGIFGFLFERQAGLGGERTIRGYQQWRFIGKGMTLANLELRYRFIDIMIFNQHLSYKLVAFVDAGNAYDTPAEAFTKPRFGDYKLAYGFGGLLTWNQATVMRMYVGFSPEDINFAVNFAHVF